MILIAELSASKTLILALTFGIILASLIYSNFRRNNRILIFDREFDLKHTFLFSNLVFREDGKEWRFGDTPALIGGCNSLSITQDIGSFPSEIAIGRGWSKETYKLNETAVKKLNFKGASLTSCFNEAEEDFLKEYNCVETAVYKFIKEIYILLALQKDPNVLKLVSYCIPEDFLIDAHKLSMLTELGTPLDNLHLLQIDWESRVKLLKEVIEFLYRIEPFRLRDFRRQQFVIIDGRPVYVDFDDVIVDEWCKIFSEESLDQERCRTESLDMAKRVYEFFVDEFLWIGHPENAIQILDELKDLRGNKTLTMKTLKMLVNKLNK